MKFCEAHWDKLKAAVEARGMWALVARDGEEANRRLGNRLDGQANPADYDPLMACFVMITRQALEFGGPYLLQGDYCPICEAVKHTAELPDAAGVVRSAAFVEEFWINGPADAALAFCRENGLVPAVQ